MASIFRFAFILVTFLALTSGVSCGKKNTTCIAFIKVIRTNGSTVSGAKVRLTSNWGLANGNTELADYLPADQLTDANGLAIFEFTQPGILDVEVTHIAYGSGQDLVKLEVGETVNKIVTIQ
jgi:hypothetical protein